MARPCIDGYLRKNSDNAVQHLETKDVVGGQYVNGAAMQVSLYTQSDVPVPGASWPLDGWYVEDSDGDYVAIIQDSIDWTADTVYKLVIEIDGGANRQLTLVRHMELIE